MDDKERIIYLENKLHSYELYMRNYIEERRHSLMKKGPTPLDVRAALDERRQKIGEGPKRHILIRLLKRVYNKIGIFQKIDAFIQQRIASAISLEMERRLNHMKEEMQLYHKGEMIDLKGDIQSWMGGYLRYKEDQSKIIQ